MQTYRPAAQAQGEGVGKGMSEAAEKRPCDRRKPAWNGGTAAFRRVAKLQAGGLQWEGRPPRFYPRPFARVLENQAALSGCFR